MLYKLINGNIIPFTDRFIEIDDMIYTNPTDEQLIQVGYKPLIENSFPEDSIDKCYYAVYTETDTEIIQSWEEDTSMYDTELIES